jgi:hypothetical protein
LGVVATQGLTEKLDALWASATALQYAAADMAKARAAGRWNEVLLEAVRAREALDKATFAMVRVEQEIHAHDYSEMLRESLERTTNARSDDAA